MTVEDRLAVVEERYRRLRSAMTLGALVLVAACGTGLWASQRDVVTARGFVIKDRTGAVRAKLEMAATDSMPSLSMWDTKGRYFVDLSPSNLSFLGGSGKETAVVMAGSMGVLGPHGSVRIEAHRKDIAPSVTIDDSNKIVRAALGVVTLTTGENTEETRRSPASLTLFHGNGNLMRAIPEY